MQARRKDASKVPGTLAWWSARPVPSQEAKRGRPRRSFEEIIDVALELVDESGAGALNMRTLAERLQTSTATLYRHVSSQDELVVYVVDRVLAEVLDEGRGARRDWREAAREVAFRLHAALSRHPNVLPLLVSQLPVGPHALRVRERAMAALMRSGLAPELAAHAYNAVAVYVVGFCAVQAAGQAGEDAAELGAYYRALDPDSYPSIVAAAEALTATPAEEEFAEGLAFIIEGIDRARRRAQTS